MKERLLIMKLCSVWKKLIKFLRKSKKRRNKNKINNKNNKIKNKNKYKNKTKNKLYKISQNKNESKFIF
jgi:hypothetical protein